MLDINYIRENLEKVKKGAELKQIQLDFDKLIKLDDQRREFIQKVDELRAKKKEESDKIGSLPPEERAEAAKGMQEIKQQEKNLDDELNKIKEEFNYLMLRVPTPPREDVPVGKDDTENEELRTWGEVPQFDFEAKDHATLGKELGIIDIERGVKIAGSRSYFLTGAGAMLEWAVLQLTLQSLVKKGYEPQVVPLLVNHDAMEGTSYFPGGEEQAYAVGVKRENEQIESDDKYLVGTAEVSLTSYYSNETLDESELPKKSCALSACFRREAGTYGKDTAGLYRLHQFHKVEQVVICKNDPEESKKLHAEILKNAEDIVQALKLPYRVVAVCTGDMGQGQVYKNDIECWMPSRDNWGETHSCSTFHDFQSRRLNLKYKDSEGNSHYCYTLNNTCVASPRILISLIENYQNADGSITIPEALLPYFKQCGFEGNRIEKSSK